MAERHEGQREESDQPDPPPAEEAAGPADLPGVDFASFCLSLATSALYHLGLVADPESGQPGETNLPVARHTIDTLVLLEEKTQGNLTEDEQKFMTAILTELRMNYVAEVEKDKKARAKPEADSSGDAGGDAAATDASGTTTGEAESETPAEKSADTSETNES